MLLIASHGARANLPDDPPDGLELSFSVTCDFEKYFWSASLIYTDHTTANIRQLHRRSPFRQQVDRVSNLHPELARDLFDQAAAVFRNYRIGQGADGVVDAPRIDERTFTVRALAIQPLAGRLDEISLSIDLTPGRQLPAVVNDLLATLKRLDRRLTVDIRCR